MKRRDAAPTGLEAAPDIMLLTMAGLMVAVVWLTAHAQERTLPPIQLPQSEAAAFARTQDAPLQVTLRPSPESAAESQGQSAVEVWINDQRLDGGMDALEAALLRGGGSSMTLRADAGTRWDAVLQAMSVAAKLDWEVSVAADR